MHQLHQPQFQMEPLLLPIIQIVEGSQHHLQKPRQVLFAEQQRRPRRARPLVGRNLQQVGILAAHPRHQRVPQIPHKLPRQRRRAVPRIQQRVQLLDHPRRLPCADLLHQPLKHRIRHRAHQFANLIRVEMRLARDHRRRCNRLVHDRQRIAHRPIARLGQQRQRRVLRVNLLLGRNRLQLRQDVVVLDRMKAEVLAARPDRLRNVLRLGGRHHENHVIRRLLQSLQEGIKRGIGDLVRLVEDPYFVSIPRRPVPSRLAELPDLVNAAVGRRIDFQYIHRIAGANFSARIADAAGLLVRPPRRPDRRPAVQRHRQDARNRRFPDPAMPGEDVPMGDPPLLQRIQQGAGHVLLPGHIGEALRAILPSQNLIGHRMLIVTPRPRPSLSS